MSILPFAPIVHCGFTLAYGLTCKWHPIYRCKKQRPFFHSTIRPERSIFFQHNVYHSNHLPSCCCYDYFGSFSGKAMDLIDQLEIADGLKQLLLSKDFTLKSLLNASSSDLAKIPGIDEYVAKILSSAIK